jgi:hypothetical protein
MAKSLSSIEAPAPNSASRALAGAFPLIAAALLLVAALPLMIVKYPVMQDYFNHLARVYAIAFLDRDQLLARYYEVEWRLIPDLAIDATVPALAKLVGVFAAGKLLVAALIVLLPGGVVALNRALYRDFSPWPLASCLFLYNGVFALGFLNYLFATMLALWGAACWIALRDKHALWRMGVSLVFTVALFFSHLLGVALYGLAVGSYELSRWYKKRPSAAKLRGDVAALAVPFLAVVPLILASPTMGSITTTEWWFWTEKPRGAFMVFHGYDWTSGILLAAASAAVVLWGFSTARLRLHLAGFVFAIFAAALYLAIPSTLAGVEFVDSRLPIAFLFVLLGLSDWEWRSAGEARGFVMALFAGMGLIVGDVVVHWSRDAAAIAEIEASFAAIPRGSRVLEVVDLRREAEIRRAWQRLFHVPALVMIERSALYSNAFTDPGKQPLAVKPPYRDVTSRNGRFLDLAALEAADREHADGRDSSGYWSDWRHDYNYLYVIADEARERPPALPGLEQVAQGRCFTLYRIGEPR